MKIIAFFLNQTSTNATENSFHNRCKLCSHMNWELERRTILANNNLPRTSPRSQKLHFIPVKYVINSGAQPIRDYAFLRYKSGRKSYCRILIPLQAELRYDWSFIMIQYRGFRQRLQYVMSAFDVRKWWAILNLTTGCTQTGQVLKGGISHIRGTHFMNDLRANLNFVNISLIAGSWGQHGAHLGPTGPRWDPCWPHELCYPGCCNVNYNDQIK